MPSKTSKKPVQAALPGIPQELIEVSFFLDHLRGALSSRP